MKTKRLLSALTLVLLLLPFAQLRSFAVEAEAESRTSATVWFSVSGESKIEKHQITAFSDSAERHGYVVAEQDHIGKPISGVTVFDVITAAHEELYGDDFTASESTYLAMSSGFMSKAFGRNAMATGFTVNGVMPNDGIFNPAFQGCTGYACDTATVSDGDDVCLFFYADLRGYSDLYSWFDAQSYTAQAGKPLSVKLFGYNVMYYGLNDWDTIRKDHAKPIECASIYTVIDGEKVLLGTTDQNGTLTVAIPKEGEYILMAEGTSKEGSPVIVSYASMTVTPQKTFLNWLKGFWSKVVSCADQLVTRLKVYLIQWGILK